MENTEYIKPRDFKELLAVMKEKRADASVIAGGTNLIPQMKAKLCSPKLLVDISGLDEYAHIAAADGHISIGAMTTVADVAASEIIKKKCPILTSAASQLGNPLTRNRATIGGNLADASPAADTAVPLLALEAVLELESEGGEKRTVPLDAFFLGVNETVLKEHEIMTRISFPEPKDPMKGNHAKLGLRNAMAISVVSIAVMLEMEEETCTKARIAMGSVASRPIRIRGVEKMLEGKELTWNLIEQCASEITKEISPISDIRASAEYRRQAASVLFIRTIKAARDGGIR